MATPRRKASESLAEAPAPTLTKPKSAKTFAGWDLEETFFKYAMYLILAYNFYNLAHFPQMAEYMEAGGIATDWTEFLLLVPTTAFSWALFRFNRHFTIFRLEPMLVWTSDPERKMFTRADYLGKVADYLSGFMHYVIAFSLSVWVAWRHDLLPRTLGGNLDLTTESSIRNRDFPMDLKAVYLFAFGHHTERLLTHWLTKRDSPTYWSMLSHHITAFGIMLNAFHMRYLMFGIPVIVLFDLSDALLQMSRFLRETRFKLTNEIGFVLMVVVWFAMRIVGFFWEIIWPIMLAATRGRHYYYNKFPSVHAYYLVCVVLLCLLNVFWFYQIMKILVSRIIQRRDKIEYEDRPEHKKN